MEPSIPLPPRFEKPQDCTFKRVVWRPALSVALAVANRTSFMPSPEKGCRFPGFWDTETLRESGSSTSGPRWMQQGTHPNPIPR